MKQLWVICLLLFASSTVSAQTIPVILGQSDNFTRFVATIPEDAKWSAQETSDTFTITVSPNFSFDLHGIMGRAINDLVDTTVTQPSNNELTIQFDCACRGSAFVYREIFLVVDIKPNSPQPPTNLTSPMQTLSSGRWWRQRLNTETTPPLIADELKAEPRAALLVPERLARELATVTNAGRTELRTLGPTESRQSPLTDKHLGDATDRNLGLNIGVSASSDDSTPLTTEDTSCDAYSTNRIFSTNAEELSYDEIIRSRSATYSDTGKPDRERLIDLAVDYLILGMPTESNQVLLEIQNETRESRLIGEIAKVIDGATDEQEFWEPFLSCRNSLYFWSAIQARESASNPLNSDILLLHFKSMSPWLQQQLTDRLYDVLASQTDTSPAQELLAYTDLSPLPDETAGDQDYTIKPQDSAIRLANRDRPKDMLEVLSSGQIADAVEISEAIRFEHQETPLWSDLLEAEITTELAARQYPAALQKIDELINGGISPADARRISSQAFLEIAAQADDANFLALYFQREKWPLNSDANDALEERIGTFDLPGISNSDSSKTQPSSETTTERPPNSESRLLSEDAQAADSLNSASIRDLLKDTQDLRSSVLEQLAPERR